MNQTYTTRLANHHDQPAIIDLIDQVYQEYGDRICLSGADQDLLDLQTTYFDQNGAFWVMEDDQGRVVGTHAAKPIERSLGGDPADGSLCTFRRLYLEADLRGGQLGTELMDLTIDWARENGYDRVEFWSDTRFSRAHQFFAKFGFRNTGRTREMDDGVAPYSEYLFFLELQETEKAGD
ncbi:MAG: GNAT family N-acetyltransferase [Mariniblastus sp.]|nr:GNAT family N-acetyltransferase [Mariniblastus sp.]